MKASVNIGKELISRIELIFDGYFLISKNYDILEYIINDKNLNYFFEEKKIQGKDLLSLISPLIAKEELERIKRSILEKNTQLIEIGLKKNGEIGFYELIFLILENNRILVIFRNVTEKKLTEQKLKESEKKYQHLFNNTPYAIWLVNLQGIIIECNENMNKLMSIFKHTDLIGKSFRDVIKMFLTKGDPRFENLDNIFKERFKLLLKQGYLEPIEFEISRGDAKSFWITLETSFVQLGKETFIQAFIKDITGKKIAELKVEELKKELEIRVKDRTIKLESSEKKYRKAYNRANCFKGLFTHDISNLFQIISNNIELWQLQLKQGIGIIDILQDFQLIEESIARGKKLINNIRDLSEIEESEMPIEPVDVLTTLENAIKFIRINFHNRDIRIKIESNENKLMVLANELLLDVFENIMINSVNYNKNTTVEITVNMSRIRDTDNDYGKLEFKDNGIGIDDSSKNCIFQESCKKPLGLESKGMGLGLSLVAKLIELCEGKIWIEDRIKGDYTQGSNFVVLIPEAKELKS
ncbi:MAG TPA: PAS domain-containing sensor histidine kinase [Candidatus Lokiarchaeia archaeon]